MTVPLRKDSPRRYAAAEFASALNLAMRRRNVGQNVLKVAAGVSRSSIVQFRHGRNLPTIPVAQRLAEALGDDRLLTLIRQARTAPCKRCGVPFVHDGAGPKTYCSDRCAQIAAKIKREQRKGPMEQPLPVDVRADLELLDEFRVSVAMMCGECEPAGFCRTPTCPLRPVSPLQIQTKLDKSTTEAVEPPGPWGSEKNRAVMLASIRSANARRWTPEERERYRNLMHAHHVSRTEEERQAWIQSIREGRAKGTDAVPLVIHVDLPFGKQGTPERNAYMREYMRQKRKAEKEKAAQI